MLRRRLLLMLLLSTALLTGCWSRVEINDRLFITLVMVDAGENEGEIKLTLGFPLVGRLSTIQKAPGSEGRPFTTVTKTADSMAAAYRRIQTELSRQINWGHTRVVIVGDKLARAGVRPVLEFVSQQPTFQTKANIFVVSGEASEFNKTTPSFERFPSEILREMAAQHAILSTTVKDLLSGGPFLEDALVGRIELIQHKLVSEGGKTGQSISNAGAALFSNGNLSGYFDVQQMRAAMWIKGQMENAVITVESPTDERLIDLLVVDSKAKVKVKGNGARVTVYIEVHAIDDVLASDSNINLQEPEQAQQLADRLKGKLTGRLQKALDKSQRLATDAFQFGEYVEWYLPDYWNRWKHNWHYHYQNDVDFVIDADVKVKRPGAVRLPYWKPTELQKKEMDES